MKLSSYFKLEVLYASRQWGSSFKKYKENECELRILFPATVIFIYNSHKIYAHIRPQEVLFLWAFTEESTREQVQTTKMTEKAWAIQLE